MTARVVSGLRVMQVVAGRPDPTRPMPAGAIARAVGLPLSSLSRLAAELVDLGLLARGDVYGSYRIGPEALEMSGRAAAPYARAIRIALTRITQSTGETALIAAPTAEGARVIGAVLSPWTLHSPAVTGEDITDWRSAVAQVAAGAPSRDRGIESTLGKGVEVAVPVLEPGGETLAVLAVRLPVNRAKQGVAVAGSALATARRSLERVIGTGVGEGIALPVDHAEPPRSALATALQMLQTLTVAEMTVAEVAAATSVRRDRAVRLMESCRRAGLVRVEAETGRCRLDWSVFGWLSAAAIPVLLSAGVPIVARVADDAGVCAFITVLRGMRSVTLVEELRDLGAGLEMTPWLGRPCPILSSDGGPALVMDFDDDEIAAFLPKRTDSHDAADFFARVAMLRAEGVMARESFEEAGQTAFAAPVRDASGAVVAAACLVGASDELRTRREELSSVVRGMAEELSRLVRQPGPREPALASV